MEKTREERGFRRRRTKDISGIGCERLGGKTYQFDRRGADRFCDGRTETVEGTIKVIKYHSEDHPISMRESLASLICRMAAFRMRISMVLKMMNPRLSFQTVTRAYMKIAWRG